MNQILDSFKKIGAAIIVLSLVLIMAISFSSQSTSEILEILLSGGKIGSYDGEEIRQEVQDYVVESCKSRYQMYGDVPKVFIDQCANDGMRDLMVMPAVAMDLGLDVSEKQIQDQIVSGLRLQVEQQKQTRLQDDRLSLEQLFQREMSRFPMSLRLRLARVGLFQDSVAAPFPVSEAENRAMARAKDSSFDMSVVAFTNAELLGTFKAEATEEEMKELYEKDKREAELRAKKEKKEGPFTYPSYQDRQEFLKSRVLEQKKRKQLEELKASLGQRNGSNLNEIAEKTGHRPERVKVKFAALNAVALPSGKSINLTGDRFLADVAASREGMKGPYQDGETTVYLTIDGVNLAPAPAKADAEQLENRSMYLSYSFANRIVKDYAAKGNFYLAEKSLESAKQ